MGPEALPGDGSTWRRYNSGSETAADFARVELLGMPPEHLLAEARTVGMTVSAEGKTLRVSGPRQARGLADFLLRRKAELLPLLQQVAEGAATQAATATEPVAARVPTRLRPTVEELIAAKHASFDPVPDGWNLDAADKVLVAALAHLDDLLATEWTSEQFHVLFEERRLACNWYLVHCRMLFNAVEDLKRRLEIWGAR